MLTEGLCALGYKATADCLSQLGCYLDLLVKWNRVFNLTGAQHAGDLIVYHILDSLAAGPFLQGSRIVDVGTGAGFPGLPLAICYPQWQFVLLDSHRRKTRFLEQAIIRIGLNNVSVVSCRVAAYQPAALFDSVITRAYASLAILLAETVRLCAPTGMIFAMKGRYPADEIRSIPASCRLMAVERLHVPRLVGERHLVCVRPG